MSYDPYQQDFYERDAVGLGEGVYGLGGSYGMGDSGVYGSGEGVYELGGRCLSQSSNFARRLLTL